MDAPQVQYARTSDGVNIAYAAIGTGPALIYPTRLVGFQQQLELPETSRWLARLAESNRLIVFDLRGFGLSDRDVEAVSHDKMLVDLDAVLRAVQPDRFSLFAADLVLAPMAIRFAATRPDGLDRLVLWIPGARTPRPGESADYDYFVRAVEGARDAQ